MIILKLKKTEVKILNSGKIYHWPEITSEEDKDWSFVGLAKNKKGDYAYARREMIELKIKVNNDIFYPVLCDSCGNFAIFKEKIEEIYYNEI